MTITLGDNSEAELEVLFTDEETGSASEGLSLWSAVPSDLLDMPPSEFIIPGEATEAAPPTVVDCLDNGTVGMTKWCSG